MEVNMLIAVLGGTSSGKTSLVSELCKKGFQKTISVTTREKRDGEKDGVDCYFVSKKDFLRLRNNGHLVESTEYCGEYYGTPAKYMTTRKVNYIAVVTPAGLRKLKREADYRSINFLSVSLSVSFGSLSGDSSIVCENFSRSALRCSSSLPVSIIRSCTKAWN